jgi:DNA-binding MarR family transcriptional regulator
VPTRVDPARIASDLRVVIGQVVRRLRAQHRFPLAQATVLGRLDREGALSVSDLALAEHVRPQSMAQTVGDLEAEGLVSRRPDPEDGRRALVELTTKGHETLIAERTRREGWLAEAIDSDLTPEEQEVLARAVPLLRRLAERR